MTQSYFDNIDLYLTSALMSAQHSIRAAVAWCTDQQILRVLATVLHRGVDVELIVNDDKTNRKADYSLVISNGGKVFFADKDSNIMHHKFCVIDHCRVICGSYNWTSHAKSNDEQLTIIDDNYDEINGYEQKYDALLMAIESRARMMVEKAQSSRSKIKPTKAEDKAVVGKKQSKFKILLDDTNATKRTFYMRENLGIEFDQFCATARIDKGALLNIMVKEWLEQNQGRVEFETF